MGLANTIDISDFLKKKSDHQSITDYLKELEKAFIKYCLLDKNSFCVFVIMFSDKPSELHFGYTCDINTEEAHAFVEQLKMISSYGKNPTQIS